MAVMKPTLNLTQRSLYPVLLLTLFTSSSPGLVQAQGARALEEVVVTAQRREQSLQEVPISIQAVSGLELNRQGFRTMEDLGQFAPSVEINESLHEHSVTIRGMGNDVANMAVEQSAPIFVDGIHFGRPSMIKGAFLDLERVEILTGPQPIYFGQNATAGAFSLTTRKPGETWEGDATAEFGNFGRMSFEGGIGGPLTDTFGIRIAGQWDSTDGHLTDLFTGNKFPHRSDIAGRLTTVWRPVNNLELTAKAEYARRRSDGDTAAVCQNEGPNGDLPSGSVLERGLVPEYDAIFEQRPFPLCVDGFKKVGVQEGTGIFLRPVQGINNDDARSGALNIRDIARTLIPEGNLRGREPLDAWNYRLSGSYTMDNGISVDTIWGLVDYERDTFESSDESPFLMEAAFRTEIFDMWSGELRVTSPAGGRFEWTAGAYYQKEDMELSPVVTVRANIRRPVRTHDPFNESEWKSAFASFTFNFLGDKASIDVGGRYTDVDKTGGISALAATWIFDINPDPDGDGIVEATQHRPAVAGGDRVFTDLAEAMIDCETGLQINGGQPNVGKFGEPLGLRQCGEFAGRAGFWTHEWRENDVPDAWDTMAPVGVGALLDDMKNDIGPFLDEYSEDSFDPQVTLRYRLNPNHSFYAKWAKAFKAGGFDTSDRGIPRGGLRYNQRIDLDPDEIGLFGEDGQKEFSYLAEHATNYEIGVRGDFLDNSLRYGATLFWQEIEDLQLETEVADLAQFLAGAPATGRAMTNAGAQRTRGLEFDLGWAATDRLLLNMAGVIQEGVMLEFIGGCTEAELLDAATGPCWSAEESEEILGPGNTALESNIDRAGEKAPRTPDWKIIFGLDYQHPVFEQYVLNFNSKLAVSDEYTQDTLGFTYAVHWPTHADLNLLAGIGAADGTWDINVYGRNILGARQEYFPEFEENFRGLVEDDMPASSFFSYGVQFNYRFR